MSKKFIKIKIVFLAILLLVIVPIKVIAQDAVFVPSLPDVPLPKGFEVDPITGTFFDSAEGRIVEMYAIGYEDQDFIVDFYTDVMGQFGWQNVEGLTFVKEGETLVISFEKGQKDLNTVRYQLRPSPRF